MTSYKDKLVGVLGAGLEGLSSAVYLKKAGAYPTLLDQKEVQDLQEVVIKSKELGIELISGEKALQELSRFEILVRTPSIRPDIPQISDAVAKGASLTSNTKIFFENCPAKIIGVTGTKGKGTTASLIERILKNAGKNVFLGGNIGTPALDLLGDLKPEDFVVLELSSFQLFDLDRSPHVAVVLMVTSEHLDWHKDPDEYKKAKFNIVNHQAPSDFAVVNVDYPVSKEFLGQTQAKKIEVSTKHEITNGVFLSNNVIYRRIGAAAERVTDVANIGLIGSHNLENVLAAVGAATALSIPTNSIAFAIKEFKGLEHRLEFVREVTGVKYYNDSFSTTPETAIAAIKSFSQPEIIILGGSDKGSDYSELGKEIINSPNIKAIVLIGQMAPNIKSAILKARLPDGQAGEFKGQFLEGAANMEQILDQAKQVATSGDVVLLSPACASFGMFKNYKDRGKQFKETVNKL